MGALSLERFDDAAHRAVIAGEWPRPGAVVDGPAIPPGDHAQQVPGKAPGEPGAAPDPCTAENAAVDRAEPPPPTPEEVSAEACVRIAERLDALVGTRTAQDRAIRLALVRAFADAAGAALPALVAAGFSAEAATAASEVLAIGAPPEPRLEVAAAEAEAIGRAFALVAVDGTRPKIVENPALQPGQVRIVWTGGGADIDREALTAAALARLNSVIEQLLNSEDPK